MIKSVSFLGNTYISDKVIEFKPRKIHLEQEDDSFNKEPKEAVSYSLQDIIETVGEKKTAEIFDKCSPMYAMKYSLVSPLDPKKGFFGQLKDIVNMSKDEKMERMFLINNLKESFLALERECSIKHEEKYGEKTDIKIKIRQDGNEAYLTDILDEQVELLRKGKIGSVVTFLKMKVN